MDANQDALSLIEEDAAVLAQTALKLSEAKEGGDTTTIAAALDANLKLWIGIRTLVARDDHPMPKEVRENLIRLANYTAKKTLELGETFDDAAIESLINTNLQISEGLLEGRDRLRDADKKSA